MKKFFIGFLVCLFCFLLCGCSSVVGKGSLVNASIDFGQSEIYSETEIEDALKVVEDKFESWPGFEMHSIEYCGDEISMANLDYCHNFEEGIEYEQCIVFESSFTTGQEDWSGFSENCTYTGWFWYLAREKDGGWKLITYGVC